MPMSTHETIRRINICVRKQRGEQEVELDHGSL